VKFAGIAAALCILTLMLEVLLEHDPVHYVVPPLAALVGGGVGYAWGKVKRLGASPQSSERNAARSVNPVMYVLTMTGIALLLLNALPEAAIELLIWATIGLLGAGTSWAYLLRGGWR
jgi:hypothetical protein